MNLESKIIIERNEAATKSFKSVDGFLYKIEYDSILQLIRDMWPREKFLSVAEIGAFKGRSTLMFLQSRPNLEITTIDPFLGPPEVKELFGCSTEQEFLNNTEPYRDRVNLLKMRSDDPKVREKLKGRKFDIFFVDGDHSYEAVKNDIQLALDFTKDDGLIMVDDFWINAKPDFKFRGVTDAVHELLMYKYRFLYLFRSVAVFQRNIEYRKYDL